MFRIALFVALGTLGFASRLTAEPPAPVGTRVADFTLPDAAGKPWALADNTRDAKATVVLFLGTECPVSAAYQPRLAELHKRFSKDGIAFVGVFSLPTDDAASVAAHAKAHAVPFPVLKDDGTAVADKFRVERVPTAFVLDAGRNVRYMGRIDDQFAPSRHGAKATTQELFDALFAVTAGRDVKTPFVAAAGCKLARATKPVVAAPTVTYHRDVSRVVQAKCQGCHRPGEPAPFSLLTYKHAKGWAAMMQEVVADGTMPPWHADAPRGHFVNDRRLTDDEKKTLLAWVEQGCPEGDPKDAPEPVKYAKGWRLGHEPDVVLKMNKPIDVPAQYLWGAAGMPYQYLEVGEKFTEDTWVQAVEVRPDYRAAIHHVIAFIIPPGGNFYDIAGPDFGKAMLAAYVPGDDPVVFPAGTAKLIPKGAKLLFEMHYTPNGKAGVDQSAIGLILAKTPPKRASITDAIFNERFAIPPGDGNHEVKSRKVFDEAVTLTALTPHMHVRGKAFKFELVTPDGKRETLLNVPKYDFNWQVAYMLAKPRELAAGSRIECTAWYDNSAKNPMNPDPTKRVRWGQQTWEEMMIGFVEYETARK